MILRVASLFSGIGAFEEALRQLKIAHKILFACDNGGRHFPTEDITHLKECLRGLTNQERNIIVSSLYEKTRETNHVKKSYLANFMLNDDCWFEDVRFLDGREFENNVDIIAGGSPCQSFSTYGKRKGLDDHRGNLFFEYIRIIEEVKPKAFIFENVPGLKNHDKGLTWKKIETKFKSLNYKVEHDIMNAVDFGLPQKRKRLFVVGIRNDLITNGDFSFKSLEQEKKEAVPIEKFLEQKVELKYYLPEKGYRYVTEHKRNEGRARLGRSIIGCQTANQQFNWTGDFRKEQPSQQIIEEQRIFKGIDEQGNLQVVRKLTPNECLRLMGFNDFNIVVPDQQIYRQSGNSIAVPVLMAIIKKILKAIKDE